MNDTTRISNPYVSRLPHHEQDVLWHGLHALRDELIVWLPRLQRFGLIPDPDNQAFLKQTDLLSVLLRLCQLLVFKAMEPIDYDVVPTDLEIEPVESARWALPGIDSAGAPAGQEHVGADERARVLAHMRDSANRLFRCLVHAVFERVTPCHPMYHDELVLFELYRELLHLADHIEYDVLGDRLPPMAAK